MSETLDKLRKKYPVYSNKEELPDDLLAAKLYDKYYRESFPDYNDYLSKIDLTPEKKSYEDETWSKWKEDFKEFSLPTTDELKEKWEYFKDNPASSALGLPRPLHKYTEPVFESAGTGFGNIPEDLKIMYGGWSPTLGIASEDEGGRIVHEAQKTRMPNVHEPGSLLYYSQMFGETAPGVAGSLAAAPIAAAGAPVWAAGLALAWGGIYGYGMARGHGFLFSGVSFVLACSVGIPL